MYDFSRKTKRVSIPEEWFNDMFRYLYADIDDPQLLSKIRTGFDQYMDNQISRELYSKYQTDPSEEEREKARQWYLERKGISTSFRW